MVHPCSLLALCVDSSELPSVCLTPPRTLGCLIVRSGYGYKQGFVAALQVTRQGTVAPAAALEQPVVTDESLAADSAPSSSRIVHVVAQAGGAAPAMPPLPAPVPFNAAGARSHAEASCIASDSLRSVHSVHVMAQLAVLAATIKLLGMETNAKGSVSQTRLAAAVAPRFVVVLMSRTCMYLSKAGWLCTCWIVGTSKWCLLVGNEHTSVW